MYNQFIHINSLNGELKRSHKKKNLGVTVSTEELVFQQPHVNYRMMLRHIVSIIPYKNKSTPTYSFVHRGNRRHEITNSYAGPSQDQYKFYVSEAVIHNRSGEKTIGPAEFVMPVHREILREIAKFAELKIVY